ncbi:hypothetical protein [Bradyrhizobium sp. LHD-71]|uniref:hypothetical protein n=1 Tax=Bradyrhizobium sp. LHD-71 TaxID=3072141 RepID=UPI00280CD859|nr:hypothetical protein [Bradyrhizobium sp. LHD-71]MDQ8728131.1 hypothetical protein [Bradyrhizobium sp. LHD-71]
MTSSVIETIFDGDRTQGPQEFGICGPSGHSARGKATANMQGHNRKATLSSSIGATKKGREDDLAAR